VTRQTLCISQ